MYELEIELAAVVSRQKASDDYPGKVYQSKNFKGLADDLFWVNNNILKEKDRIQLDEFVIDHFTPEEALKIINSAQHEEFASFVHQRSLIIGQKWKKT